MKKKHLLLILLMVLLAPWAANAQTVLLDEGFETMTDASYLTDNGYFTYSQSSCQFEVSTTEHNTGSTKSLLANSWDGSSGCIQILGLPTLSSPINKLEISFAYKSSSGTITLGYLTDDDYSTFTELNTYSTSSSWTTTDYYNLSAVPTTATRIAIRFDSWWNFYVDDIIVRTQPTCVKPTGLAATLTPGDGTIATLSWTKGGEETDWVLEYSTSSTFASEVTTTYDGDFTVVGTTVSADLMTLTPETTYYARVKADCSGGDESDWSTTCSFQPTNKTVIGSGDATDSNLPTNTYYNYSISQQIYSYTELGDAGYIESIDFYCSAVRTRDLDIYMVHTDKVSFSNSTDWIIVSSGDKVFSGSVAFTAGTWTTITLNSGFNYNGTQNVAIVVVDNTGSYVYAPSFKVFSAASQAIYNYNDDDPYDPTSTISVSGTVLNVKNQIRILKGEAPSCPKPTALSAVISHTAADLTWTGYSDSYTVEYQTSAYDETLFFEDFESGSTGWTTQIEGEGPGWELSTDFSHSTSHSMTAYSYDFDNGSAYNADNWLISPQITMGKTLKFWAYQKYGDEYEVLFSTSNSISSFDTELQAMATVSPAQTWVEFTVDLTAIMGQTGYIAIHHEMYDGGWLSIDDFGIYGDEVPAGGWTEATTSATDGAYTIEGLTADTKYDVRVKGNCGGEYSDVYSFTTYGDNTKIFKTAGDWNVADNWEGGIPTIANNAIIRANVTIPSGVVATAKAVTIEGLPAPTITIKNGGQLKQSTNGLAVTVEKFIPGYGAGNDKWQFISTPLNASTYPTNVTNMLTGDYDLYSFNGYYGGAEWRNYENGSFTYMGTGNGYLYANSTDQTLTFTGTTWASYNKALTMDLTYYAPTETQPLYDWKLVGNTFVCNGYLFQLDSEYNLLEADFYVMNSKGDGFELSESSVALAPCEGALTQLNSNISTIYFASENPLISKARTGILNIYLAQSGKTEDMARVRFGEGYNLGHMSFRDNTSTIYIPQEDKDYAVVYTEAMGEMPLNFKAETTSQYTISMKLDGANLGYLHLYDKITGEDINLFTTPEYSFIGSPRDMEDRFIIRFSESSFNDTFVYQNGDELIVNGEGTLQVFDVMGRFVTSMKINGSERLSASQFSDAMFIFRLVGSDVKTQKIVVR